MSSDIGNSMASEGSPQVDPCGLNGSQPDSDSATLSFLDNRISTHEENRFSQILLDHVLPPFNSSLKLQALVVYQSDQEKMKCLLLDRVYRKTIGIDAGDSHLEPLDQTARSFTDSGFLDLSDSPMKSEQHPRFTANSPLDDCGTTRRKRKLCKPCKIPQNGLTESALPTTSTPNFPPSSAPEPSSTTFSLLRSINSTDLSQTNVNGLSDSVLLPVSAVTLLPSLGVFSLPITVLSALPRPILPRASWESLHSQSSVPQTTALNSANGVTLTTSSAEPISTRPDESKIPISSQSDTNRRVGKSFVCNQCRKDFASLNLLCAHTFSVHRGFRCTICRAQFTQRSNLQRHSLRHVGFKPFVCKICEKSYYRKDHLVRHIELAHPGCDPRVSLTVKLSSAECLDYLDKLQRGGLEAEQAQLLYQMPDSKSPMAENPVTLQCELKPSDLEAGSASEPTVVRSS